MTEKELTKEDKADAARLKKILEDSGMTQEEAGDVLGITQGMVGHMVNGRRKIHLDAAIDFSILLRVTVGSFSPSSQIRINSAYNSPAGGNLAPIIEILQKLDGSDLSLAADLLRTVVNQKIGSLKVVK